MTSYRIDINPDDPESIRRALKTEWLLTNGLGGYAMGTALGVNTRRYHGLLVAATKPPVGRIVALHSMIEQLILSRKDGTEEVIDLSTQQFVGGDGEPMLHPNGWRLCTEFTHQDLGGAVWQWFQPNLHVVRALQLSPQFSTLHITYAVYESPRKCRLRLRPITPLRDFHAISSGKSYESAFDGRRLSVRNKGAGLALSGRHVDWFESPEVWSNFAYSRDRDRGQDWIEHAWSPGYFEIDMKDRSTVSVRIWPEIEVRTALILPVASTLATAKGRLLAAGQQFVVGRWFNGKCQTATILAGYPWFGDWGRDTMISLPGLLLCTERFDEARKTLLTFARNLRNGLIPNLFDDYGGGAHYNSVDASLWFVYAVYQLCKRLASPSGRGVRGEGQAEPIHADQVSLLVACREIIEAYRRGTDFNIRMEPDGLIAAGDETSQLTWMDAKRDGVVFTPRHGKAVEINALWFNALRCFAEMTNDDRERHELMDLSVRVGKSFREQFWWNAKECLHDVLLQGGDQFIADEKLRPNQIFAVSLPFSPLDESQQRAVAKIVGDRLLTPFGLRTLDRDDPNYKPRYEGNLFQRDAAYHNGTVWPWLIGPYCEALLRVEDFGVEAKERVRKIIQPLIDEMSNTSGGRCLGQIPEVYDGDPPHNPGGCPAQAWSVAEVLRILSLVED